MPRSRGDLHLLTELFSGAPRNMRRALFRCVSPNRLTDQRSGLIVYPYGQDLKFGLDSHSNLPDDASVDSEEEKQGDVNRAS